MDRRKHFSGYVYPKPIRFNSGKLKNAIDYIKKLISTSPDVSSKRFMALIVTFVVIAIAFINIFSQRMISEYIFKGLVDLACIGWGAVSVENIGQVVSNYMNNKDAG